MKCLKPWRQGVAEYDCGQCVPCRIKRKRLWSARLVLESFLHKQSLFVTLTYADKCLPEDGSVSVREMQNFMKRLREIVAPEKVRYFAVGEYGDISWRPHYHLVLYGNVPIDAIRKAWPLGFIYADRLSVRSAMYVAGYVMKKMTAKDDERLKGKRPEFSRMSLRPGIGAGAAEVFAKQLVPHEKHLKEVGDVPSVFRVDGDKWPFGRYLRRKLRVGVGWSPGAPAGVIHQMMHNQAVELINDLVGYHERRAQSAFEAEAAVRRMRERKGVGL